jgi:hypothetical protein
MTDFVGNPNNPVESAGFLAMQDITGGTCAELFANTLPGCTSIREFCDCGSTKLDAPATGWWMIESVRHTNPSNYWGTQVAHGWKENAGTMFERNIEAGVWSNWRKVIVSTVSGRVLNRQFYDFFDVINYNHNGWYKLGTFSNDSPWSGAAARINLRTGYTYTLDRHQRYYGSIDLRWGNPGGVEVSTTFSEGNIQVGYTTNDNASSVAIYLNLNALYWAYDQAYEVEIFNKFSNTTWQNLTASSISGTPAHIVSSAVVISTTNNTLIGTITDNGVDKLQVAGSICASAINSKEFIVSKVSSNGIFDFTYSELGLGIADNISWLLFITVHRPTTDASNDVGNMLVAGVKPRGGNSSFSTISTLKGSGISSLTADSYNTNDLRVTTDSDTTFRCIIKVIALGGTN